MTARKVGDEIRAAARIPEMTQQQRALAWMRFIEQVEDADVSARKAKAAPVRRTRSSGAA